MNIYQPVISGSLTVTGSTTFFGNITVNSGSLTVTSGSLSGTASYALTSSFADSFNVAGNLTASAALVTGTLTAQTLVVQTITSSIVYSSGSNRFGNSLTNTQTFTGSVNITGSTHAIFGNVGIGITNPSFPLEVSSSSTTLLARFTSNQTNAAIRLVNTSGGGGRTYSIGSGDTGSAGVYGFYVYDETGASTVLAISASGWIGIGTNNPAYGKLSIMDTDNTATTSSMFGSSTGTGVNAAIYNLSATVGSSAGIRLVTRNSGAAIWAIANLSTGTSTGDLVFGNGTGGAGTEKMRITNGGNVGIGTTSPTGKLDVASRGITVGSMPAGSVIQVVSLSYATGFSTSSTSDTDTGLNLSITPTSSTSKILIIITSYVRAVGAGGNQYIYSKVWRGSVGSGTTLVNGFPAMGNFGSTDIRGADATSYLDSPATTSAITYRYSLSSLYATTVYLNSTTNPSTITLMEIAQ